MKVLVALAGAEQRRTLMRAVSALGLDPLEAADGTGALDLLMAAGAPRLALVDWDLPGLEGVEVCRLLRDFHLGDPPYIILLAQAGRAGDVPAGLRAGANDVVVQPVATAELRSRIDYGRHVVELPWGRPVMDAEPCAEPAGSAPTAPATAHTG